jgi:hypothetical protein
VLDACCAGRPPRHALAHIAKIEAKVRAAQDAAQALQEAHERGKER